MIAVEREGIHIWFNDFCSACQSDGTIKANTLPEEEQAIAVLVCQACGAIFDIFIVLRDSDIRDVGKAINLFWKQAGLESNNGDDNGT